MPVTDPVQQIQAAARGTALARTPVRVAVPDIIAEETYLVRNEHRGPTTYTHGSPVSGELYRWSGKGDPDGLEVQAIPGYVVKSPGFQRSLAKRLFSLVTEDEENPLDYAGEVWADQNDAALQEVMGQMEREADLELHDKKCLGPGPKGSGQACGETVFIRGQDLLTRVPLCPTHDQYARYFVLNEETKEWNRMSPSQVKASTADE